MARQSGTIRFAGSIGNITGYRDKNGNDRIRQRSSLDSDRLHNDIAFEASRTAWPYLGMASKAGAAIRQALAPMTKQFCDHHFTPALVGICQKALREHHPHCPPAAFDYSQASDRLQGLAFRQDRSIYHYAQGIHVAEPDYTAGTLQITTGDWSISPKALKRAAATHLRWTAIVAALPAQQSSQHRSHSIHSAWTKIGQRNDWSCDLPFAGILQNGTHAVIALALESAQLVGNEYCIMDSVKAMNIVKIIAQAPPTPPIAAPHGTAEDADAPQAP
jgi:hypothetical protein